MTLNRERIRAAVASLCIGCQFLPPRHCGRCPCCRPVTKYRFYRIWDNEKFYLFCRSVGTPIRENAKIYTQADWEQWGKAEGLEREEADG